MTALDPEAPAAFAARILRPERPRLAAARAAVAEIAARPALVTRRALAAWRQGGETEAAREAWETLAARGVIPLGWTDEPSRSFATRGTSEARPHPPTARACIALASDPDGVATAELLARECAVRLRAWGLASAGASRVRWRVLDRGVYHRRTAPYDQGTAGRGPHAAVRWAALDRQRRVPERDDLLECQLDALQVHAQVHTALPRLADAVAADVGADLEWRAACRLGLRVARGPAALLGRPFATLANPFEPLIALWRAGYALDALGADALVLVAPDAEP